MRNIRLSLPGLFIFLLLLSAAFKDDIDTVSNSEFWSELALPGWLSLLKRGSDVLLFVAGAVGLLCILRSASATFTISRTAVAFLILIFLSILRAVYDTPDAATKLFMASLLALFVFVVLGTLISRYGAENIKIAAARAFIAFASVFIAINGLIYVLGYGFVPNNPRFFGTATHPNFIGVQLAISNLVMLFVVLTSGNGKGKLILGVPLLCAGLWLMLSTGSRTALMVFIFGAAALLASVNKYRVKWWMFGLPIMALSLAVYITISTDVSLAFQRGEGGGNTRALAWGSMLRQISESPWIGHGYYIGYSENSYLRAMSAFGVLWGVALLLVVLVCALKHSKQSYINRGTPSSPQHLFFSLMVAISFGGLFEGYIVDSWSLPRLTFLFLLALIPASAWSMRSRTLHAEAS